MRLKMSISSEDRGALTVEIGKIRDVSCSKGVCLYRQKNNEDSEKQ